MSNSSLLLIESIPFLWGLLIPSAFFVNYFVLLNKLFSKLDFLG